MSETNTIVDQEESLFDRVGGGPVVNAIVDGLYKRILADDRVNVFFKNTDIPHLKGMMIQFLHALSGGPVGYKGKPMREAHAKSNIQDKDFDIVAEHLSNTLQSLDIQKQEYDEFMMATAGFRNQIVIRES
ncbi:group 1 truncated hemoglobin [uncultured Microbulbifer sp.]|uniref:group I truncated hemoglobin n=1 Tax=uncultured Microbulbifer sp. TaxID=348147 RepID=UPI0026235337|nr:group 1 truncated hemoglobin [uncultured Microbulbifer sp.]